MGPHCCRLFCVGEDDGKRGPSDSCQLSTGGMQMSWVEQNLKTVCPPVWVHFSQSGSNWEALLKCKRTSRQNPEPGICIQLLSDNNYC